MCHLIPSWLAVLALSSVSHQHCWPCGRAFMPCLGCPGFDSQPIESNQRVQIGSWSIFVWCSTYKGSSKKNLLTLCQNNVRLEIIIMCMQCDISIRQLYEGVIILSATSWHCPDMIWNVLKLMLSPIQKKIFHNHFSALDSITISLPWLI